MSPEATRSKGNGEDGFASRARQYAGQQQGQRQPRRRILHQWRHGGNPNVLKGQSSNVGGAGGNQGEQGAEFRLADSVKSLDGNKADGASVANAAKCPDFPKKNGTLDFVFIATPFVCE